MHVHLATAICEQSTGCLEIVFHRGVHGGRRRWHPSLQSFTDGTGILSNQAPLFFCFLTFLWFPSKFAIKLDWQFLLLNNRQQLDGAIWLAQNEPFLSSPSYEKSGKDTSEKRYKCIMFRRSGDSWVAHWTNCRRNFGVKPEAFKIVFTSILDPHDKE